MWGQIFSVAGAVWWVIAIALFGLSLGGALLQPVVQRRRPKRLDRPAISAIVPVKCLDPGFKTTQTSIFLQDYPDYEILVSAAERQSPALDVAREVAAAFPARVCRFLCSEGNGAVSPKLNTLAAPLAAARNDFVFTKDSNITLAPDAMAVFMQNFAGNVGLVVAVPVAVRPETFAGRIEACLINGHARLLLTASALGLGFGVGKTMLFRRSDLAAAGGVEAISHSLAEDTALSQSLAAQGLKTVFAHRTVGQEIGARTLREIYDRQVRWSVIRRANERFTYPLEPLSSALPAAFAGALAAPLAGAPGISGFLFTFTGWFFAETTLAYCKGWDVSLLSPLAFVAREILSLAAWLRAWTTYDVVWAQGRFDARKGVRAASRTQA
ncbi:glycosyltransferase [Methylocapsa palsarum]|uniref:Ceramide glucosyltransferase n=1 Tax=Methylocapsa palsarum TaxID=1612308 RepID=A0A1I4BFZ3_9HYPH|nr:glycosyltransferase [Methylocapsa palsarum]SFK67067.1 ceramide glucosyltransferase [Methylocapsa palsarum]